MSPHWITSFSCTIIVHEILLLETIRSCKGTLWRDDHKCYALLLCPTGFSDDYDNNDNKKANSHY